MSGISPKQPLRKGNDGGLELTQTLAEETQQNFLNLLRTNPGERLMDDDYGCGLESVLFELNNPSLEGEIQSRILVQTKKYLPFISLTKMKFFSPDDVGAFSNTIQLQIEYIIKPLGISDRVFVGLNVGEL